MKTCVASSRLVSIAVLAGALLAVGCTQQSTTEAPRITDKTFSLNPGTIPVRVGILAGELTGLSVLERVNASSGDVVYAPQLRGTLKLKNTSSDEAVSLVNGRVDYLDAAGNRIKLAEGRGETTLQLYSYSADRLDPGEEATHAVDIPFPASALKGKSLAEIRLSLTYLPTPYQQHSVEMPVAVGQAS
jgi:hypothetical protein